MIEVQIGEAASYAAAGVDIHAGDEASQLWQEYGKQTYANRAGRFGELALSGEDFTSIRMIDLDIIQGKRGLGLLTGVDGAGTKPEIAQRATARRNWMNRTWIDSEEVARDHTGIAHDVVAMVADDMSRDGGEPIAVDLLFDASTLKHEDGMDITKQLAVGSVEACRFADIILMNGETAELGNLVGGYEDGFHYNLGGFVIGAAHRDRVIDGSAVEPGQAIVAFREHGFRANGMSLVRKVLAAEIGPYWHQEDEDIAKQVLQPSQIYTRAFVDIHGGYDLEREPGADVSAIVHVTGGGIPGKLQRKLAASGRGAVLDNLFQPPSIMRRIQDLSMRHETLATPDADLYQTLNGGIGALVITSEPDEVRRIAVRYGIDSRIAGEVVKEPGIQLRSHGLTDPGEWIHYIPRGA